MHESRQSFFFCSGRLKREEQRIAKEMAEREQEEARKLLEAAQKKIGGKRLNIADGATLDKDTLMSQVPWPLLPFAAPPKVLCLVLHLPPNI